MKHKVVIAGVSAILFLGGAMAVGAAKSNLQDNQLNLVQDLPQTEGQKVELEMEHGQSFYKVEMDDDDNSGSAPSKETTAISLEEASKIALKTVNGTITEIEKEFEHGRLEYKFEIESTKGEVDIHIDAETGKVTEIDYDDYDDHDDDDDKRDD